MKVNIRSVLLTVTVLMGLTACGDAPSESELPSGSGQIPDQFHCSRARARPGTT
jgi:hypothetical protein